MLTLVGRGSELDVCLLIPQAGKALGRGSGKDDLPSPTLSAKESEAALRVSQAALHKQFTDKRQRYEAICLEESDKEMTDLRNLGSVTRSRTIPELD